jgi:hypothetical protein
MELAGCRWFFDLYERKGYQYGDVAKAVGDEGPTSTYGSN